MSGAIPGLKQDCPKQVTGHCHLGQLKGGVAPVSDDLGTDLHQLLSQCGQWPVFDLLGQRQISAVGYKQTLAGLKTTSASPPGADLPGGVAEGPFLTQAV